MAENDVVLNARGCESFMMESQENWSKVTTLARLVGNGRKRER